MDKFREIPQAKIEKMQEEFQIKHNELVKIDKLIHIFINQLSYFEVLHEGLKKKNAIILMLNSMIFKGQSV